MTARCSIHVVILLLATGACARLCAQEAGTESRSYDLRAIVGDVRSAAFVLKPRGSLVFSSDDRDDPWDGLAGFEEAGGQGAINFQPEEAVEAFAASRSVVLDRDTVTQRVVDALASAGVDPQEEAISWSGNILTLKAPRAAFAAVEASLAPILELASSLVSVDCLLVPLEVLDGLAPAWRSERGPLPLDVFTRALLDGRSRLLSVAARSGQRAATGSRSIKAMVTDQAVNQTGVIPVMNPVIEAPFSGDRLEVRPLVLPGRKALWLDLVVGRVRIGGERKDLGGDWGEIELPDSKETFVSTTVIVIPGTPIVAGVVEDRQGLAAIVRAELRQTSRQALERREGETTFGFYDARLLLAKWPARRWPSWSVQDRLSPAGPRFHGGDDLAAMLQRRAGTPEGDAFLGSQGDFYIDFRGPEAVKKSIEALLEAEMGAVATLASVDIDILAISRAGLAKARASTEDGSVLAVDWRKSLESNDILGERRCAVTGVAGQTHALRQASVHSYLADVNQVSGGTGFAVTTVSDPEFQTFGDGLELRVLAEPLPGGRAARVRLEGASARAIEERPFTVTFPVILHMTGTDPTPESPRSSAAPPTTEIRKTLSLSLPHLSVDYWSEEVEAPLDRDVILHASAGEGDTASLLIGRVRIVR